MFLQKHFLIFTCLNLNYNRKLLSWFVLEVGWVRTFLFHSFFLGYYTMLAFILFSFLFLIVFLFTCFLWFCPQNINYNFLRRLKKIIMRLEYHYPMLDDHKSCLNFCLYNFKRSLAGTFYYISYTHVDVEMDISWSSLLD